MAGIASVSFFCVFVCRVEFLRKKANRQLNLAKVANQNGKKDEALHNLKRKKVIEKEVKTLESRYRFISPHLIKLCLSISSSILTIEEQILKIEGGAAVTDVYEALHLANRTMQLVGRQVCCASSLFTVDYYLLFEQVHPDKLAELMNDIEHVNADFEEVNDILTGTGADTLEDPELLAELEGLDADRVEEQAFQGLAIAPTSN